MTNKKLEVVITKFQCAGLFSFKTLVISGFTGVASISYMISSWITIPILMALWGLLYFTINREVNNWLRDKAECEVRVVEDKCAECLKSGK